MSPQNAQEPFETQQTTSGYRIYHFDNVPSTNDMAKKIARRSEEERIVIVADTQTRGRGRLGRQWISPKGGLWLSIIVRPQICLKEALKLTFITSTTVARTLQEMFGLRTEVKWPNDVLVNGRKICGILTETSTKGNIVEFAVVGIGLNVNIDLETFPSNLRKTVTSLKCELNYEVKRKALMENLLEYFERRYKCLLDGKWDSLLQEWKNLSTFLGKQVRVTSSDESYVGIATDVDCDGAFIIKLQSGEFKKIVAGDVTVK